MWVSHQLDEPVYRAAATDSTAIVTKVPLMRRRRALANEGCPGAGAPGTNMRCPGSFSICATGMTVTSGDGRLFDCWPIKLNVEALWAPVFLGTRYHPQATRMTNNAMIKAATERSSIPSHGKRAVRSTDAIRDRSPPNPADPYRLHSPDFPPVFSNSRICPITAPLSRPLTMS